MNAEIFKVEDMPHKVCMRGTMKSQDHRVSSCYPDSLSCYMQLFACQSVSLSRLDDY